MKIQNSVALLTLISKYFFNLQVILRLFYLQIRDTVNFKWTLEFQQTFDRVKKELTDGALRLAIPNSGKTFRIFCDALNYVIGAILLQKSNLEKWN